MVDISTTYLGLHLQNPLVASSSPLTERFETSQKLEAAGVGGLVMYSLFEEQIIQESLRLNRDLERGSYSTFEALSFLPEMGRYTLGADVYVERLQQIKKAVNIPVIGSLNGFSTGGWIDYAQKIEQAGADALELNLYYLATDPDRNAAEIEDEQVQLVGDVTSRLSIPLTLKLSPFYTSLPHFACRVVEAGAKGLVLFNRFYQPDFDLDNLEVVPHLVLSNSNELRLPLRWIAILYGHIKADFALTSGVHTAEDMLKAVMAGACVTYVASEFLENGIGRAPHMLAEFYDWMEEHEYTSVEQMKGSMSQHAVADPSAFERANYMKVLSSY